MSIFGLSWVEPPRCSSIMSMNTILHRAHTGGGLSKRDDNYRLRTSSCSSAWHPIGRPFGIAHSSPTFPNSRLASQGDLLLTTHLRIHQPKEFFRLRAISSCLECREIWRQSSRVRVYAVCMLWCVCVCKLGAGSDEPWLGLTRRYRYTCLRVYAVCVVVCVYAVFLCVCVCARARVRVYAVCVVWCVCVCVLCACV